MVVSHVNNQLFQANISQNVSQPESPNMRKYHPDDGRHSMLKDVLKIMPWKYIFLFLDYFI